MKLMSNKRLLVLALGMGILVLVLFGIERTNTFATIVELVAQVLLLWWGVSEIRFGIKENRRAKPFSFRKALTEKFNEKNSKRMWHDYYTAMALFLGPMILLFLLLKLWSCGVVCGPEWW